ncbi:hypothetical protein OJAV_G00037900 [Oryzias javanicus]|uniref:Uncharacterized protein n=1 Tax=Oryzias javanicus TaxID=123683 RepID=A0A437DGV3_ORYJA|nr:hypothetical protein OJAV_G00037900 [Oryzias javanicus]
MKAESEEVMKTNQNLHQVLANLKQLRNAGKEMKEERLQAENVCVLLEKEIKALKAQLLTRKQELSETQKNGEHLEKEIKQLESLVAEVQSISEEQPQIEEQKKKLNDEISNLKKQKENLTQMVADHNTAFDQIEKLREDVQDLTEEKLHLTNILPQLRKLEAECNAAKEETSKLMQQKNELEQQVQELFDVFENMEKIKSELKDAKKTNSVLIAKNISLEMLIKNKTQDLQSLEMHHEALQKELNDHQSHLQKSKEMEDDLTRITHKITCLKDLAKQQESEILLLKDELAKEGELETHYYQHKDSLVSWKQKTENLEKEKARLAEKLQNPKTGTWGSHETVEDLNRNLELNVHHSVLQEQNVQNNIPAVTKECLTANKTADYLQTKVMDLKVELHTLKQETVDFQEELKDLQKRNQEEEKIRLTYRAMLLEKWDLEMKRDELKTRVSLLRQRQNKGSKLGLECKKLKEHLDSVKQETEKLNQELHDLQGPDAAGARLPYQAPGRLSLHHHDRQQTSRLLHHPVPPRSAAVRRFILGRSGEFGSRCSVDLRQRHSTVSSSVAGKQQFQHQLPTEEQRAEAERLKSDGNDQMKVENFAAAVEFYSKAIALNPQNAVYYCNRAAALSKLGNYAGAVQDCEQAIGIDPNYSKAYGRMGLALASLNKHTEAVGYYKKALELDPDNDTYKTNLKIAEEKMETSSPTAGMGGVDLAGLLSNPGFMNMASSLMSNPQVQQLMSGMMSGAYGGPHSPRSRRPVGANPGRAAVRSTNAAAEP